MEKIVAAAIEVKGLVCFVQRPGRHHDVFHSMDRAGFSNRLLPEEQGFVTDRGRFVKREEARQIAERAEQLIASDADADGNAIIRKHRELFSEDVW